MQHSSLAHIEERSQTRSIKQLLKWVGNKQRFAREIVSYFPATYGVYYEPFLGSGAVLGALAPERAVGSDHFPPLIEIWQTLHAEPHTLKSWYAERWQFVMAGEKVARYEQIKASYNARPNGADLLFLCRACYGGVMRFRQRDGYMSTPCGVHQPMPPEHFERRVDAWTTSTRGATFLLQDYRATMEMARAGDLIYCDPPYCYSQRILYGAQSFDLRELFDAIRRCKERGVFVALSLDGSKRSGKLLCDIPLPAGLFAREVFVQCGRSMLKRFQMDGQSLEQEVVCDRLLLTY